MSGSPITFKGQHPLNAFILVINNYFNLFIYVQHNHQIYFGYY